MRESLELLSSILAEEIEKARKAFEDADSQCTIAETKADAARVGKEAASHWLRKLCEFERTIANG